MITILKLMVRLGMLKTSSVLANAGKSLSGYKTYGGGLMFLLMGVIGIITAMWPDLALSLPLDNENFKDYVELVAGGLVAIGAGHKLDKNRKESVELSKTIQDLVEILGGNAGAVQRMLSELAKHVESESESESKKERS